MRSLIRMAKQEALEALYSPYRACIACPLGLLGRNKIVFGAGNPDASIMLIGEAPGEQEDKQGLPFIGKSGNLLTKTLETVGIGRAEIFITSIVKCRPPKNRAPLPLEVKTCKELLLIKQIEIIKPKIICTLGAVALEGLLGRPVKITRERGLVGAVFGATLIPTVHPAYVLRNPAALTFLIEDLLCVKELSQQ